jgi:hypothetical protein
LLYSLYGLTIASDLVLPELARAPQGQAPDVRIRLGRLADGLPTEPGLHRLGPSTLLNIAEAGRYCCVGPDELRVEPLPGVPDGNVRLFLLGSALSLVLHRRGLLPLHGNAVAIDGRAFVFLGPSGSGKSTLAAWFHDRGYPIVADDVAVVAFDPEGRAQVPPGLPRLRLWRDVVERTGRDAATLQRSFAADDDYDKFDVPASAMTDGPLALAGVLLLERGEATSLNGVSGAAAVATLFANIYRGEFLSGDAGAVQWRNCVRVARDHRIMTWRRRWSVGGYDEEVERLLSLLRATPAG